ncbi:hypothetical protein FRC06_007943 [Ceratobasidium sp. 370]|nr:hypothetical protein FRC06_007943 [Ceratobasidium sp. 370]
MPMSPTTQLTRYEGKRPEYPYATMIGKLMYAALCTRPDIAFAVTYLSQFSSCFGPAHITAVKHVFRYLKGTPFLGITYRLAHDDNSFGEVGYTDSDWGTNSLDRKSISGNVFLLGGAAVSWSVKKQPTVALSMMEAKYMVMSHACTQALWMRQFFEELLNPITAPTLIVSDNLATLTLSVESQFHGRLKHIDICHHFLRDIIEKRKVTTLYVPSHDNIADAFTKALTAPQFSYMIKTILGSQVFDDEDDYLWN